MLKMVYLQGYKHMVLQLFEKQNAQVYTGKIFIAFYKHIVCKYFGTFDFCSQLYLIKLVLFITIIYGPYFHIVSTSQVVEYGSIRLGFFISLASCLSLVFWTFRFGNIPISRSLVHTLSLTDSQFLSAQLRFEVMCCLATVL